MFMLGTEKCKFALPTISGSDCFFSVFHFILQYSYIYKLPIHYDDERGLSFNSCHFICNIVNYKMNKLEY